MEDSLRHLTTLTLITWATVCLGCSACKTPTPATADATPDAAKTQAPAKARDLGPLVSRVEIWRDRTFPRRPAFRQVDTLPPVALPASAAEELASLQHWILGRSAPAPSIPQKATYDPTTHTINHTPGASDADIIRATLHGLDTLHITTPKQTPGWDAWLATHTTQQGITETLLAMEHLSRKTPKLSVQDLASAPDRVTQDPALLQRLRPVDASLLAHAQAFARREGLSLTTAYLRSQRWNGPEYLLGHLPTNTANIVRPERLMRGESTASWTWPDTPMKLTREGRVGAATASFWLRPALGAGANAISRLWQADAYRVYDLPNSGELFVWSIWLDTPSAAASLQPAMETALKKHLGAFPKRRFSVSHKDTSLQITIGHEVSAQDLERSNALLAATPSFPTRPGHVPMTYVPSDAERLTRGQARQTFDTTTRTWIDPDLGATMRLKALPDWKLELNRRGGIVRWYARKGEELIQMTVERRAYDAPDFLSQAYLDRLTKALSTSWDGAKVSSSRRITHGDTPGIEIEIQGGGKHLTIWHLPQGAFLYTFSLQTQAKTYPSSRTLAVQAFSSLRLTQEAPKREKDAGILEFKVEP